MRKYERVGEREYASVRTCRLASLTLNCKGRVMERMLLFHMIELPINTTQRLIKFTQIYLLTVLCTLVLTLG